MNRRALERFVERQWRQDSRQPSGEHGFAGARRTDHQQVVTTGRRDLERPPRERLPAKVGRGRALLSCGRRVLSAALQGGRLRPFGRRLVQHRHRLGQGAEQAAGAALQTTAASATLGAGKRSAAAPRFRAAAAMGNTPRAP